VLSDVHFSKDVNRLLRQIGPGRDSIGQVGLSELVISVFWFSKHSRDPLQRITSELSGKLIVQVDDVLPKHHDGEVVGRGVRLHRWNLLAKNKVDV
jgi:hypothetical protein